MTQRINHWQKSLFRQFAAVILTALCLFGLPAFTGSAQAVTNPSSTADPYLNVDQGTVKRVKDMAEDHVGDRDGIGNVGLKNIRKLGENIPETAKVIFDQRFDNDQPADIGDPSVVKHTPTNQANNPHDQNKQPLKKLFNNG